MKVDGKLNVWSTTEVVEEARHHEKAGYDGLWASESKHDPFLPLVLAAEHTDRLEVGTAIAVEVAPAQAAQFMAAGLRHPHLRADADHDALVVPVEAHFAGAE